MKKTNINLILRIIAFPAILSIMLIKYNYHSIKNSFLFLKFGGEWITYAKKDEYKKILDIYMQNQSIVERVENLENKVEQILPTLS